MLSAFFDGKEVGPIRARGSEGVAIDGKCQRGRLKFEETKGTPCHLLSAFCHKSGLVLGQLALENKEAELTVAPQLLKQIEWEGRVVTGTSGSSIKLKSVVGSSSPNPNKSISSALTSATRVA